MKKIIALFTTILLSTGLTFAAIDENKTSDVDTLKSYGYSESALRVMDTVNYLNKGGKYQRRYVQKEKPGVYTNIKLYLDPMQDDDKFAEHEINFTNTWNGDETRYSTRKVKVAPVENL